MAVITLWHNPRCSKSRQTLAIAEEVGQVTIRKYLQDAPTADEIRTARDLLGVAAIDMMRAKEPEFRELGLSRTDDDETLIAAMATCPKLIERPIVFANGKAALGRPPEQIRDIL